MAYGGSNDDVIDDVTCPWKVKVVILISLGPVVSYKIHLADICTLWAFSSFMYEIREISGVRFMPEISSNKCLTLNSMDITQWNYNSSYEIMFGYVQKLQILHLIQLKTTMQFTGRSLCILGRH